MSIVNVMKFIEDNKEEYYKKMLAEEHEQYLRALEVHKKFKNKD
ncbi:hypothetical protein SAMN04487895_101784 [Paenibacillus sophorae]|uniref:Uncharacterized protein n=1 Tax=Paenibacillus sophorae TaxID=1333845 RepID=A0A1H8H7Z8_9BACL|nr:hypothetical protein [Paenibacillus sophorae]SEN52363.1 hypothetical protein SAMN04487895_101784 [Paenibacillus sophorae]